MNVLNTFSLFFSFFFLVDKGGEKPTNQTKNLFLSLSVKFLLARSDGENMFITCLALIAIEIVVPWWWWLRSW